MISILKLQIVKLSYNMRIKIKITQKKKRIKQYRIVYRNIEPLR